MKNIVAVILGGGRGTRLFPLTKDRSKPAVPLAGRYRLIDVTLSNCINSEIRQVFVLTMFQSASLNHHLASTYRFDSFSNGFVSVLAAEQTAKGGTWFQGTADAVRQAWVHINSSPSDYVLVLSGDHLYRMDYQPFAEAHRKHNADISIAVHPVSRREAPELGILKTDSTGRIVRFVEKPTTEEALNDLVCDTTAFGLSAEEARERPYLASMGIYLFKTPLMRDMLHADQKQTDFGKHIVPQAIKERNVRAYLFNGYWADIGTIRAFYDANIDLVQPLPKFNFYDASMPIFTHARPLPGAKLNHATVEGSILCEGAIVDGATVRDSILGLRSLVYPGAVIEDSIVMGADYYQEFGVQPRIGIGENTVIRRAIVDKNASIGRDVKLVNQQEKMEYDDPQERFYVRDGVIIVVKNAVIPDGLVF